jgi:N-acetylmuramoyl-L-alanine amidase
MRWQVAARVIVGVLALVVATATGWADTIVVRGHRIRSPVRFEAAGEEVYAPLLGALGYLEATWEPDAEAIRIITANRREILVYRHRPEATRDGVLRDMPGVPREVKGRILVPAKAVASAMGCSARWDEESRTLYVYPWIRKFQFEELSDRYRLTIGAEAPIRYQTGELSDPPRLYLDLPEIDLSQIPSEFAVEDSYVRNVRIHQHSLAPAPEGEVVRVVVEFWRLREYRIRESEDRCRLEIEFPLPRAEGLPPDVPPVILTGMSFERTSPRVAAIKLGVFGTPYCTSASMYEPTVIGIDIANAQSQIRGPLPEISDSLVEKVALGPAPSWPGTQRLMIALSEPTGHAIAIDEGEVRVLLGRFELAELKIVIDPGHGGHDTGAIGRSGLQEKELNLDIALRVYRHLKAMGVNVVLTRPDANPVRPWARGNREQQKAELLSRCKIANGMDADLFVSIHANARHSNPMEHRGTETYYRKPDSFAFARVMQDELVYALRLPDGGVIRHPKSIIVLSHTEMPSVLAEVGYLSHPADEMVLLTEEARERAAQGIVSGVRRYVERGGLLEKLARRERERARAAQGASAD